MKGIIASLLTVAVLVSAHTVMAEETNIADQLSLPLQVFLVRHAEKVDASEDPHLSAAGQQRALALAHSLQNSKIEAIHSSGYIRTRDTAAPLAQSLGQEVELYDVENLPALAEQLRQRGGRHLVVGHSDTTPEMVTLLGGEPGPAIDEATEYDRLYLVAIDADATVTTILLRYGANEPDPAP